MKGKKHKKKKEENFKIIKDIVLNKTITVELTTYYKRQYQY